MFLMVFNSLVDVTPLLTLQVLELGVLLGFVLRLHLMAGNWRDPWGIDGLRLGLLRSLPFVGNPSISIALQVYEGFLLVTMP